MLYIKVDSFTHDPYSEAILFDSFLCISFYFISYSLGYSESSEELQIMAPRTFSLICFRLRPPANDADNGYTLNAKLVEALNCSGNILITHTVYFYQHAITPFRFAS